MGQRMVWVWGMILIVNGVSVIKPSVAMASCSNTSASMLAGSAVETQPGSVRQKPWLLPPRYF